MGDLREVDGMRREMRIELAETLLKMCFDSDLSLVDVIGVLEVVKQSILHSVPEDDHDGQVPRYQP